MKSGSMKMVLAALLVVFTASATAETVIEDWEDGDDKGWSGSTNHLLAENDVSKYAGTGSYYGNLSMTNNNNYRVYYDHQNYKPKNISFYAAYNEPNDSDLCYYRMRWGSKGRLVELTLDKYSGDDPKGVEINENNVASFNKNQLYKFVLKMDFQNYEVDKAWMDGSLIAQNIAFTNNYNNVSRFGFQTQGNEQTSCIMDYYAMEGLNSPPSIDSKDHLPKPTEKGDQGIDYTANASDADGDDMNAWLTVEYWNNGTNLVTDKPMNEPSTNDFKLPDVHDATVADDGYNATFTVSDGSENTTAQENFYIEDNAPGVNLKQPKNQTYFDYDTRYKAKVTDGDDVNSEEWNCEIKKDGTVEDTTIIKEGVNSTYSKIIRTDFGSHLAEAVCTDNSGNTGTGKEYYSVDQFKENGIFAQKQVYETVKEYFDLDAKYGDMVQEAAITLYYDSKNVSMKKIQPSGVITTSERQYHEIPLVTNNASSHSYSFTVDINQSDFNSGYETVRENSSTGSQTVWKSLFLENQTTDRSNYAGGDNIYYTAYLRNKTSKIEFSKKDLLYNQTSTTYTVTIKDRPETELLKYTVKVDSKSINSSKEAVALNPDYQASFNSQTRKVNAATIERTLEQLDLSLCSNSNGDKALIFNTYKETDRSVSLKSELDYAIQYWNPDYPDNKKVLNGSNSGTSTHEFCLEPGYASAKVDSTKKLIQYTDTKDDYVLRSYFLINQTVKGGNPARIPLYMLAKNKSSRVKFTVEDENRNALSGIVIRAERYFPDVDKQLPVAMVKTGAEGQTETFLQVNEIYYGFKIYRDGKLVKDVPQQVVPSDLELLFTLGDDDDAGYYDYEGQVGHTCDANATQVTCSYSSETEALEEITLKVEQDKPIGWKTLNKSSLSTSSGELTIKGFNATSSRIRYELEASFSDGVSIVLESDEIGLKSKPFGETGLMLSFFLFMTMSFAGLWKPSASILLGTFSLVISSFLPFLAVTQTALTALVALGAVIIWRMTD